MSRGKFISIEGIEGAGKSTTIQFIKTYLMDKNIDVIWTREPGGTEIGEQIRQLLLHSLQFGEMSSETELLLMFASRAQHIKKIILPALENGQWVATDQFIDASYAYQGGGRGINVDFISMLDKYIVGTCYPDLTFLLDLSPKIGFDRTAKRGSAKDRIEQEKLEFFNRVRKFYLKRAKQDPHRIKIINASVPLENVLIQIREDLDELLAKQ